MIRPPGTDGVAFSERADGDLRGDTDARAAFSARLAIPDSWATAHQVHGNDVALARRGGDVGEADALWTTRTGLPVAVFTADCFGVVLHADGAVGVAHAGWRGTAAGVVAALRGEMTRAGHPPQRAAIGPGIGACCFEVGPEVAARFPGDTGQTSWATISVDLVTSLRRQLGGVETWASGACTLHDDRWFSHRRDATPKRLASVGWL